MIEVFVTLPSLQEIICCIGHPVSANPTQYVMEQAVVAAGLDYRCLTLDVSPDDLASAVAGMRAMGFLGAIFAAPHQTQVVKFLDGVEEVASRATYIDFVVRVDDQLVGDCLLVAAIAELLTKLDRMPASAVIFGCTAREQMISDRLVQLGMAVTLVGQPDPSLAPDVSQSPGPSDVARPELREANNDGDAPSGADAEATGSAATNGDMAADDAPVSEPVLPADPAPATQKGDPSVVVAQGSRIVSVADYETTKPPAEFVLMALEASSPRVDWNTGDVAARVAMDLTDDPVQTNFLRAAKEAGCHVYNSVDVRLMTLVIAFRRWTNIEPDDSMMRDALEEFLLV